MITKENKKELLEDLKKAWDVANEMPECEVCLARRKKEDFASANDTGGIYICQKCWDDDTLTDILE